MLSSMSPTIVAKDGKLFMVTGTPGGRTIINTVLMTILNVIDFGMNAQEAVDAGPHAPPVAAGSHQSMERYGFSADTIKTLQAMGHTVSESGNQGVAEVIVFNAKDDMLEGGVDRRARRRRGGGQVGVAAERPRRYVRLRRVHVLEAEPALHAQVAVRHVVVEAVT